MRWSRVRATGGPGHRSDGFNVMNCRVGWAESDVAAYASFSCISLPGRPQLLRPGTRQLNRSVARCRLRQARALAIAGRSRADLCTIASAGRPFRRETRGHHDGHLTGLC